MSTDVPLEQRLKEIQAAGNKVCAALMQEILKLGFSANSINRVEWQDADFVLKRDPFSGEQSVEGIWRDGRGQRVGMIVFHAGGRFYSEYDVARPHPNDKRWFVEAVTAWGEGDTIKAEPRLLAAVT